jgi:hypothetical protein
MWLLLEVGGAVSCSISGLFALVASVKGHRAAQLGQARHVEDLAGARWP